MADVHSKETRSYNMSRVRGSNTKPEMIVRKFLFSKGFRYLIHNQNLPGKPDLTFPKFKTVIFVNGCFWHGHEECKYFVIPKTRTEWWLNKINQNKRKDTENSKLLNKNGWNVVTVWECELKPNKIETTFSQIISDIKEK